MAMIEYQRQILADSARNQAFHQALKKLITPGCTVVDVGAGTGFLGFLALQLGAGRCICIEREPEFHVLSKEIAKLNKIRNCEFICAHSRDVKKKFDADIVISETLGNFAYEENILETLSDARRFLRKGGSMIPQMIEQYAAPVITDTLWKDIASWNDVGFALDWTPGKVRSVNNMYVKDVGARDVLKSPLAGCRWDHVDFMHGNIASVRKGKLEWSMDKATSIYGLCLWWNCVLHQKIALSTSPSNPPTHWQQIYLPLERPMHLKQGEVLRATIESDSRPSVKIRVRWQLELYDRNGRLSEKQAMDMKRGL